MPHTHLSQTAGIPPLAYQDYPVDIQVRILGQGAKFGGWIETALRSEPLTINISPHDLALLNRQFQQTIQPIARRHASETEITIDKLYKELYTLAEQGHYAARKVFGRGNNLTTLQSALDSVQEQLNGSRPISIQFTTESFFLPWEMLYLESLEAPINWNHFWGVQYVITRKVVQNNRAGDFVSPNISYSRRPSLGLLTFIDLPQVKNIEIPYFNGLHIDGRIDLRMLRPLDAQKKREELQEFARFWNESFHLAHFACHAVYQDNIPDESYLELTDRFPISLRDMDTYDITDIHHPLVVLNACETGTQNPLYTASFAQAFLARGARGVVASECLVPDIFAADFAMQLYDRLLDGAPLGHVLLAVRRYFFEKYDNPSGLMYALYGAPSIRLVRR